jgi:FtsP/CotA-like multicopper oxidase with cupredoxin domain
LKLGRRAFLGLALASPAATLRAAEGPLIGSTPRSVQSDAYGSRWQPPARLGPRALEAWHRPPPPADRLTPRRQAVNLRTVERPLEVADGLYVNAWTYNGGVPGPVLRARQGDTLEVDFENTSSRAHNVHFHGRHDVGQDGWQPVPPGARERYLIAAGPPGLHPYHCHVPPIAEHIARGMYGALIVDPPQPRPPAHEFVLVLGGWPAAAGGRNQAYAWNGIAGYYARFPLKVAVGELVRLYVLNMVSFDPVASFHLHAETFDVWRTGWGPEPDDHTDIVTLGQSERVIVEFRLPRRGRYMFHPHQTHMAEQGAMGWIVAV